MVDLPETRAANDKVVSDAGMQIVTFLGTGKAEREEYANVTLCKLVSPANDLPDRPRLALRK